MAYTYGSVTNCKVRNGQTRNEYECRLGYEVQSQSIENNTSTVKLRLECRSISSSYTTKGSSGLTSVIDGSTVKNNASVDMSNTNTWQNFGERTITITHNADGTCSVSKSGSFTCTAGSSNYSLSSGNASVTVAPATIPRASQPTLSSGSTNIGSAVTIYMNRVSTSFTHYVYAQWASKRVEIGSNVTDNVSWTLPVDFCNDIPSAPNGWGTIYVDTYSGGTYVGTKSVGFTGTVPSSVVPNIGTISLSEANSSVSSLGVLVQGKSSLNVNINTSGSYSSWITNCKVEGIDNTTYWSTSFTSGILQLSGTRTVKVTVTDSRGRTATKTTQYTCVAYSNPSISVATVTRCNEDGTANEEGEYVKYSFKASISSINNKNTYSYKLGYKNSTSSSYTYITISNSAYTLDKGNVIISGVTFSVDNSYDFEFLVTDYFTSTSVVKNVGTGFTLMDFRYTGKGVAIGKASEKDAFEVAMDTEVDGDFKAKKVNAYFIGIIEYANWYHIGKFKFTNQGQYAILDCCMGDGQNGGAEQNTHAKILLKQGWTENELPIGVTTNFTQNYKSEYNIVISHIAKDECNLYIRLPFRYNDLTYVVNGSFDSFAPVNKIVSNPTYDKESTYYNLTKPSQISISERNTTDTWIPVMNSGNIDYTLRQFYNNTPHTDYPNNQDWLITNEFLSYWNGAYNSSNSSNLTYCSSGIIVGKDANGTATVTNLKVVNSGIEAITSGTDGNTYFGGGSEYSGKTTNIRGNTVRLYAHTSGAVYLGYSGSTAVTSDENLKEIYEVDDKYIEFFNNLKPITYVYKNKGHRNHMGFGARQVEEALAKAGLTTEQFAGVLKDTDVTISADEMGTEEDVHFDELYSLRYEEFIALNTMMIQKQAKQIEEQNNLIADLKTRIEILEKQAGIC